MAIKAVPSTLRVHVSGQWRTDWHYRTTHSLAEILESGNDYWLPCAQMLQPGDQIIVESEDMTWQYTVSVRVSDYRARIVAVEMIMAAEMDNGVKVFNRDAVEEEKKELERQKQIAEDAIRTKKTFEKKYDTPDVQAQIEWKGKAERYAIVAYGRVVEKGYSTKEAAQHAMGEENMREAIEHYRALYMETKKREIAKEEARQQKG